MHGVHFHARPPDAALLAWLRRHGVIYEIRGHRRALTALGAARAEGISPRAFLKVVGVRTCDGRRALLVVEADSRLDLAKAARVLGAASVTLLHEADLEHIAPFDEVGALAPIGELYRLPVIVDTSVRRLDTIEFQAGNHRAAVRVERAAWERAAAIRYADLRAEPAEGRQGRSGTD